MKYASDFRKFTLAYLEAALWAEIACGAPEDTGDGTFSKSFQDYGLDFDDIDQEAKLKAFRECRDFWRANLNTFKCMIAEPYQHGHDFWLTRNHHGAGFQDRGYERELEEVLTDAAHVAGSRDLYLGDDGKIYGF